jgi:hypothetical protein
MRRLKKPKGETMDDAAYIGFDGAQYAAKFSPASAKLGGRVSVGVLRVFRNHIMVDERITTAAKSSEFFSSIQSAA